MKNQWCGGKGEHREGSQATLTKTQARDDGGSVRGDETWLGYISKVELTKSGSSHPVDDIYGS